MEEASPRPYFLPDDLDFDSLPRPMQVAISGIIQPAYDELVLQAPNALERSAGASFVCLLLLELLDQFQLGQQVAERVVEPPEGPTVRDAELMRYLKLIAAKERAGGFLMRVRTLRTRQLDPFAPPIKG